MTKPTQRVRSTRADLYQEVTDRLIALIEAGTAPWQQPWDRPRAPGVPVLPVNAATGKGYRGINVLLLLPATALSGDPRWCSYRQAEAQGWQVRHGEHGTAIYFYKRLEIPQDDQDDGKAGTEAGDAVKTIPLLRRYTVFHAAQIDGIPSLEEAYGTAASTPSERAWEREGALEALLARSGATISHRGSRAFYRPSEDVIYLPPRERFPSAQAYYGTALHELGHWTGHARRLHRPLAGLKNSPEYGREELRAELASAFLNAEHGVHHDLDEHAAYLSMYLERLRQDKKEIFRAAKDAQAIADLIMDRHPYLQLEQGSAVPRTTPLAGAGPAPEPKPGRVPEPPGPAPIDTVEAAIAAHLRLVRGALREPLPGPDNGDRGELGHLVYAVDAAMPLPASGSGRSIPAPRAPLPAGSRPSPGRR